MQFLGMLQRKELALDKLAGLWAERDADRKVRAVLTTMLSGSDAAFVKYLAKRVPGLRGSDIAAILMRATVSMAFPRLPWVRRHRQGKPAPRRRCRDRTIG